MPNGFVKIYGDRLLNSTLWEEAPEVRLVFISMLAIADRAGFVDCPAGVPTLARRINLPTDYIERALAILEAPDPRSRSKSEEGRRLLRKDGGWLVVTYMDHREYRTHKQEADRKRIAAQRAAAEGQPALHRGRRANPRASRAVVDELEARERAGNGDGDF